MWYVSLDVGTPMGFTTPLDAVVWMVQSRAWGIGVVYDTHGNAELFLNRRRHHDCGDHV